MPGEPAGQRRVEPRREAKGPRGQVGGPPGHDRQRHRGAGQSLCAGPDRAVTADGEDQPGPGADRLAGQPGARVVGGGFGQQPVPPGRRGCRGAAGRDPGRAADPGRVQHERGGVQRLSRCCWRNEPLRAVGGARDGRLVGGRGLLPPAEPAQQVGAGRVEQVVAVEAQLVDQRRARRRGRRTSATATAPVERHDGGRARPRQLVVEREDLAPVGVPRRRGVAVHGVDRGLDLVGPGLVAAQARADQRLALGDHAPGPSGSGPGRRAAPARRPAPVRAGAAGLGEQQQGEQAQRLGLVGHQLGQQPGQADRLGAQVAADQVVAGRGGVPLVEDQVDDREHEREPVGQLRVPRHPVRDARGADLALGPDQALGHRRLGHEEGAGDLRRSAARR